MNDDDADGTFTFLLQFLEIKESTADNSVYLVHAGSWRISNLLTLFYPIFKKIFRSGNADVINDPFIVIYFSFFLCP